MSHLVGGVFAQHQGEHALVQPCPGAIPAGITAVHENIVLPAVPMEVAVQHHLPLCQQPAHIGIWPPAPPQQQPCPTGFPRLPHLWTMARRCHTPGKEPGSAFP